MIDGYEWFTTPDQVFRKQGTWKGWGDFLGNGTPKKVFHSTLEHVELAENLARSNRGVLPHKKWLLDHGYGGLVQSMYKHPDDFDHIEQHKPLKSLEEWVLVARDLVENHGGFLPSVAWLFDHELGGLVSAMYRQPSLFLEFKQRRIFRSMEENLADAKALCSAHGGILPCLAWLNANGFQGVIGAMRRSPVLFRCIKQEKRNSQGRPTTPYEATYDADDPTKPKGCKITQRTNTEAA